jgi:ubiquinone/menaquinone biosynthesis C-methylase UbiE
MAFDDSALMVRDLMISELRETWDEVAAELTSIPLVLEHVRYAAAIKPLTRLPKSSSILEAGCGAGRILRSLDAMGYENLTAIELSLSRLHYVQFAGPMNAKLVCSDAIPFNDNQFDAIVSAAVIEHVTDPRAWLAELARVVRPGGVISIVTDPYIWRWLQMLGLYKSIQPIDRAIWPWKLLRWAREAGLTPIACGGFVNVPEQRQYFVRQLKRLTSIRRWIFKLTGIRTSRPKTAPDAPAPEFDEVGMIVDAVRRFPRSRKLDMGNCLFSYENYFWFTKA